jgi:hypothetical protein
MLYGSALGPKGTGIIMFGCITTSEYKLIEEIIRLSVAGTVISKIDEFWG